MLKYLLCALPDIAEDATLDLPVFEHALKWLEENEKYSPDVVIQLRPTSPIRPMDMVDEAVNCFLTILKQIQCVGLLSPARTRSRCGKLILMVLCSRYWKLKA